MHVILKDPQNQKPVAEACVERSARTCYILFAHSDRLQELVEIVRALKVPEIRLVLPQHDIDGAISQGWEVADDLVVLVHR